MWLFGGFVAGRVFQLSGVINFLLATRNPPKFPYQFSIKSATERLWLKINLISACTKKKRKIVLLLLSSVPASVLLFPRCSLFSLEGNAIISTLGTLGGHHVYNSGHQRKKINKILLESRRWR